MKRKICVVTGTRAEYGLLYWLMKEIEKDEMLELQLIATGMHLSPEFGLTYKQIEEDGFKINEKVEMLLSSDSQNGITKSMGLGIIGLGDAFVRLKPNVIVLLGDRYEILVAAQAALVHNIPISHLSGGEVTEGVIDEAIRHSITKMSHLHFVSAEEYRQRVIQLGENPNRVYNFGDPGLDNINRLPLLSKEELEKQLDFSLGELSFLVTYHPVTLNSIEKIENGIINLLAAIDEFPNARVIITKPNSDAGGRKIIEILESYANKYPEKVRLYNSLGQLKYLSAMKCVNVILGNSSSGIVEAPALKKVTVNIGSRQSGRLKALSIIDCDEQTLSIIKAIEVGLSLDFQKAVSKVKSLYGTGNTSYMIKEVLKNIDLTNILVKRFYDVNGDWRCFE